MYSWDERMNDFVSILQHKYVKKSSLTSFKSIIIKRVQEFVTEEETKEVIGIQSSEGSYEKISYNITEKLGVITTENISSSVRITDERIKKFDTKVWNTFITIAYCNKVLGKHKPKWMVQNERAIAWLNTQIKDEKFIKEVLESCEKVVIEKIFNMKKELLTEKVTINKVFLTIPLLSTLVILFFLEYEEYDKTAEVDIFTQIGDRVKDIISQEYINEIDNQIKNLQPIKKLLLEYLVIQKDKRATHIINLVENCNSFYQDLLKNEKITYLIPFTITFAIVHLTVLRESLTLKVSNFGIDELKKIISQYQSHFTNSFDQFIMWRMNQITTKTSMSNDSNSKSLFSFRVNGEVRDNISNKTVNYFAKSSNDQIFTKVFDLIKLRMLNEAKAELMKMFLPIFSLGKFIPDNNSYEPYNISGFWIGPYGIDTFPDGQHNYDDNFKLFYNISEDDPGVITKIKLRHGSIIDSMQIFYEDGRTGRIGNGRGGREYIVSNLDDFSRYIIAVNLRFGRGLLCGIEFIFNDGKTTGFLGYHSNIIGEIRIGPFGNHNEFRLSGITGGGGKVYNDDHDENVAHVAFHFQYVQELQDV